MQVRVTLRSIVQALRHCGLYPVEYTWSPAAPDANGHYRQTPCNKPTNRTTKSRRTLGAVYFFLFLPSVIFPAPAHTPQFQMRGRFTPGSPLLPGMSKRTHFWFQVNLSLSWPIYPICDLHWVADHSHCCYLLCIIITISSFSFPKNVATLRKANIIKATLKNKQTLNWLLKGSQCNLLAEVRSQNLPMSWLKAHRPHPFSLCSSVPTTSQRLFWKHLSDCWGWLQCPHASLPCNVILNHLKDMLFSFSVSHIINNDFLKSRSKSKIFKMYIKG